MEQEKSAQERLQSLEEKLAETAQKFIAKGYEFLERAEKGEKIPKDELAKHEEMQAQFKKIQQMYAMCKQMGLIDKKKGADQKFNEGFRDKLREMESSVANIVKTSEDLQRERERRES